MSALSLHSLVDVVNPFRASDPSSFGGQAVGRGSPDPAPGRTEGLPVLVRSANYRRRLGKLPGYDNSETREPQRTS
jgi:hypothetical protein